MSKIGQIRVKRYWPGKAPPDWADGADEQTDLRAPSSKRIRVSFEQPDDSRLRRLAGILTVDRDEIRADHRRIRLAEVVVSAAVIEDAATDEDEDAVEENRRRIRERLLKLRREADDDEEEEEKEESEYETDSEEEEACRRAIEKPVYVLKEERVTIAERERLEAEVQALEEAVKRKIAERKAETKQIVVEKIRGDYEIEMSLVEKEDNVDTDDEANEAEEYESWKAREIARIKRGREDREAMFKEKEERKNTSAPKQKWTFMQKYYHKGAFFQDDPAGIYNRDFSAPTGDDKLNKTILPKVMQVKHFGKSGRTKWTHLVNEDTTLFEANNPPLRSKYFAKMAAMNTPIAKPKGSKKLETLSSLEFWPS